jgi:hypothetical protein
MVGVQLDTEQTTAAKPRAINFLEFSKFMQISPGEFKGCFLYKHSKA